MARVMRGHVGWGGAGRGGAGWGGVGWGGVGWDKAQGKRGGVVKGANGTPMIGLFCAVDTCEMHMLVFKNSENLSVACEICSMKRAGHARVAGGNTKI